MQIVLVIPFMSKKVDIKKIKAEIVSYVGTRLVDTELNENAPAVLLKESLSETDKSELSKLMATNDQGVLAFIEFDEDDSVNREYIDAKIV